MNEECVCEWPNGDLRKVMVTHIQNGNAHIIWNERHQKIPGRCGCVIGMEDTIPIEYLYWKKEKS